MKLPALASVSPMKAVIVVGVLISIVVNYNEFYGDNSAPATPTADQAVTAQPSVAEPPRVARSPIDQLKDSAEAGNVKHQLTLAAKYSTADGVVKDHGEASRWYLMAAQGGNVPAMHEISLRYRHGYGLVKNIAEADVWRQRAASGGHAEAAQAMAHTYGVVTGRGAVISKDKTTDAGESSRQLVTWLSRAAESGSAAAKHELALVRLFGISRGSTNTSYLVPLASATAAAMQLLTESADSGYWASQQALAEIYQTGYADITPNLIESNKWWQRLNEHTDASVQASIGAHYLVSDANQYLAGEKNKWQGKSLSYVETNQIAFEWFARAGAQANRDALWQLAVMEYSGTGTSKNPARALQLHQKAAELGQLDAMYHLGVAYTTGNAVPKDYASALHWLVRSASYEGTYGSNPLRARAQNALGALYESGAGIGADSVLAYAWYQLASADGLEDASKSSIRLRQQLNSEQLLEAEDLARNWKPGSRIGRRS